jgi:DNA-binding transcriptional MerR regulator
MVQYHGLINAEHKILCLALEVFQMAGYAVSDGFSFGQVVTLSGVKSRTLDHWAATSFLTPSIKKADGTGTRRVYSFSDVVAARVARDLRSSGASLQGLRKVVRELRKLQFTQQPLAEARLIVSGRDVFLKSNQDLISTLTNPGQVHFPFVVLDLETTIKTLRSNVEKIRPRGTLATESSPLVQAKERERIENIEPPAKTVKRETQQFGDARVRTVLGGKR